MNAEAPPFGLSQRLPPSNLQAEQALLGALLASNKAFERVREFLRPEHFADPVNAHVFAAVARRIEAGQLADAVTLKAELENSGSLDEVGGTAYLAQLLSAMVGIISTGEYGRVIYDTWLRRELIGLGEDLVNDAFGMSEPTGPVSALVVTAVDRLLALGAEGAGPSKPKDLRVAMAEVLAAAEATRRGDRRAGLGTGIPALDRAWRGIWPGCLDMVAARPGAGKTALLVQIAVAAARQFSAEDGSRPRKPCIFSLEMADWELASRLLGGEAGVATDDLREARFDVAGGDGLVRAQHTFSPLAVDVIDKRGQTLADIAMAARVGVRRHGVGLLLIDHLVKVRPGRDEQRLPLTEQLRSRTSALKDLAGDLGVPIILAHQLGRDVARRDDPRPRLDDMLNAGEQDADNVILMWQPEARLLAQEPKETTVGSAERFAAKRAAWAAELDAVRGLTEFIFAKRRNGPQATVRVPFDAQRMRFGADAASGAGDDDPDLWGANGHG